MSAAAQGHSGKGNQLAARGPQPVNAGWTLVAMVLTATILSWLFLQADAISTTEHQRYARNLRALHQADAELNAAVLASRLGVQTDFDTIVASITTLHRLGEKLENVPDFLPDEDRLAVLSNVNAFRSTLEHKIDRIDLFKRELSVLRNSLSFLPLAADQLIEDPAAPIAETRPIGIFVRGLMTLAHSGDPELALSLSRRLQALEARIGDISDSRRSEYQNVLLHGRVVLQRKPALEALTREILETPTGALGEAITLRYARGFEHAARRAHHFQLVLYLLALVLSGYLALAMLRIGRTSRELKQSNLELKDRVDALQQTRDDLKLYATVFAKAAEGMLITDGRARVIAVNPAFSAITGYGLAEMLNRSPSMLSSGRQSPAFYREMWQTLERRGQWQGEIWNRRKNGEIYPEWLSITAVRDNEDAASHYIAVFSDITERKHAEATIHHLAHHDPLTSLPNRVLLQDRLNQAILQSRRLGKHTAVLLMNLDRFKIINDTLGHERGDELLQQVARRCQHQLHDTDTVARTSSDEFALVLPDIGHPQDAAAVARRLLLSLGRPYQLGEHDITVTASIGIALYDADGSTAAELLRNADAAMNRAKSDGRNNFQFYAADMNTMSLGDLLLENQLRGALDRGELELHYQPKVCAATGALIGAEALLRWRHPELGVIAPGRFVPVAEDSGLIVPIGEWVLQEACRQLRQWSDAGLTPVPVAVNLSAQQFTSGNLPALVGEVLSWTRIPAALLELELTETMLMRDVGRTMKILAELRSMGVGLSIDDFGTGYSSLAYLKQFPVNVLKIDRSFVNDIHREDTGGKIATAVIALAHSLGMAVVAEGVETEAQRDFLLEHGCDQFQGYLFGRPVPAADFELQLTPLQQLLPRAVGSA